MKTKINLMLAYKFKKRTKILFKNPPVVQTDLSIFQLLDRTYDTQKLATTGYTITASFHHFQSLREAIFLLETQSITVIFTGMETWNPLSSSVINVTNARAFKRALLYYFIIIVKMFLI